MPNCRLQRRRSLSSPPPSHGRVFLNDASFLPHISSGPFSATRTFRGSARSILILSSHRVTSALFLLRIARLPRMHAGVVWTSCALYNMYILSCPKLPASLCVLRKMSGAVAERQMFKSISSSSDNEMRYGRLFFHPAFSLFLLLLSLQ